MTSPASTPATPPPGGGATVDAVLDEQARAVDRVVTLDLDTVDDPGLQQVLAAAERDLRRLQALQARVSSDLTRRRVAQARQQRPDDPRAGQKAARAVRSELTDQLGITPSRAKQVTTIGRQVEDLPATRAAHADGSITDQHVRVIAEVTAHTSGTDRRTFERQLVDEASRCRDAVAFGRRARQLLIERDHDAAMRDERRRAARRSGRVAQTEDGTTLLRLDTSGVAGELVHTVVDAFRTPDARGEHRTAEQRTHDAILAALEVALRSGEASTQHGVRPHVAIVVPAEAVRDGRGVVQTRWTGPLPYAEVARLLGDCALTRLVADATNLPLAVSKQVRTVPAGLWQTCVVRDGGCIWPGCDAPPGWCDVAHLATPYANKGKLTPDTAGLLCSSGANHHARFDRGDYEVRWVDGRPEVVVPTSPTPRSGSGPDADAPGTHRVVRETAGRYRTRPPRSTTRHPAARPHAPRPGPGRSRSP